jgi:thiamine biosynthesis lipoprotein
MIRSIEFRAMNTVVMLAAEGERGIEGMQAAKSVIDECEQRFSRFLPASEVSELNHWAGEWIQISEDLMEMLQLSMKYHHGTQGIFDPAILSDLKQAGYGRSMDKLRAHGANEILPASSKITRQDFSKIDLDQIRVRLPRGMEIDLGGVAKGWIVREAANLLHSFSHVCGVSAGGDILFIGQPSDGRDWDVYLEDPRDPTQMLAQFHIPSGAVATSSVMKRTWQQAGKPRHHLIDPRTGEPAQTEWLSVTVIHPDIIAADIYAKTILIGGRGIAETISQTNPELTYIAVDPLGHLVGSTSFKEYMYEPASDIFFSNVTAH